MQHSFNLHDLSLTVQISGRMTHADHKSFREILGRVNETNPRRVVFDLAKVEFLEAVWPKDFATREELMAAVRGAIAAALPEEMRPV